MAITLAQAEAALTALQDRVTTLETQLANGRDRIATLEEQRARLMDRFNGLDDLVRGDVIPTARIQIKAIRAALNRIKQEMAAPATETGQQRQFRRGRNPMVQKVVGTGGRLVARSRLSR